MTLPVAILAGGFATRLMPLTKAIPKSLVEVAGEPFIFHQLRLLASHGVTRAVLLLGHMGMEVAEAVGDGSRFGLAIACCFDGPEPRGTAGAIINAMASLAPEFGVLYGDSYLTCDYGALIRQFRGQQRPGLMTVFRNEGRWGESNVLFENGRIVLYDKAAPLPAMRHIDYGFGLFRHTAFAGVDPERPSDLADIYHRLSLAGDLAGIEMQSRFHEIGSFAGLTELRHELSVTEKA